MRPRFSRTEASVRPSLFFSVPEKRPRTVCGCHPVAAMISATVTPSGRRSSPMTSACFDWRGMAAAVFATWVGLIRLRGARAGLFCCCLTVLLPARRVCFRGPLVFAVPALADLFIRTSAGVRRRLAPSLPEAPPTRPVRAMAPGGSEHVVGGMGMDALYEREVQSNVERTAQPRGGLAACGYRPGRSVPRCAVSPEADRCAI